MVRKMLKQFKTPRNGSFVELYEQETKSGNIRYAVYYPGSFQPKSYATLDKALKFYDEIVARYIPKTPKGMILERLNMKIKYFEEKSDLEQKVIGENVIKAKIDAYTTAIKIVEEEL